MITAVLVARLMFNLREAGKNRALLSNNQTAPTKVMSTFCPAERSEETDETGDTSVGVGPHERPDGRLGSISFRDIVGIEEFNVDLGGGSEDDDDGWDRPEDQPSGGQDVERQVDGKEAYEMDNAQPTTSTQIVVP